jgi:hypothetical protein
MMTLTSEQWKQVDIQAKSLAYDYAQGFEEQHYEKEEIHKNFDGYYEQRGYGSNYYWLEKELGDIIEDEIRDTLTEDELEKFDARMIEGFHDLVIDFEGWLTEHLPNDWYVYFEDSDIWVARSWDDVDNIPEDVKHLVNE